MNNKKTNDFKFSITNVIGEDIDNIIVYSNEGYMIKTKIDSMPNGYRKNVLWNFGDGNTKIGQEVSHYYTKPGKYEITCTLFHSTTKEGTQQEYKKTVYVKELIPSSINIISSKSEIKCSKIEKIASLECLLSNTVSDKLDVNVKRVDVTNNSYFDVKDKNDYHIKEKYWTLLRNEKQFYYGTNKVYSNNLVPSELFTPSYTKLYYKFNDELSDIVLYQIAKHGEIAAEYKTIKVLKPNCKKGEEVYSEYIIENISDESELPQNAIYCGMRGFVDVFYKTDDVEDSNKFSIFYDIENKSITNDLKSSTNYLNIIPNELSVKSIVNTNNIKIGVSGNCFLNDDIGDDKVYHKTPVFIDNHFEASLYNGLDLNCYIFPFCSYENDDVIGGYYIPKDIKITKGDITYNTDDDFGLNSEIISEDTIENDWLIKLPIKLQNYIDVVIPIKVDSTNKEYDVRIYKKPLRNLNELDIPQENTTPVNIDELLNSYMRHPSLIEKKNLRDMLKAYLNGIIPQTQSKSENFIDNVANIRTCYLSNLLSQIKMMGDDVIEFENTNLEGINDLKNLVRFISMNHTDLVGHKTDIDWDIEITSDTKGKHVGSEIGIRDTLTLCNDIDERDNLSINFGKIKKVQRYGENDIHEVELCDVIVRDKFTNKTEIVNFRQYLKNTKSSTVKLEEYDSSWGWNLLLPDGFETISNKIKEIETSKDNNTPYYKNEKMRLQHSKRELLCGYYDFYYLIPKEDSERRGNFLDEKYINKSIESVEKWNDSLGISHDMVMKVLLTNGELLSERNTPDVYDGIYEDIVLKPSYIYKEISLPSFDVISINMVMRENDSLICKSSSLPLDGVITIQGKVYGEGENDIWIDLNGGKIDEKEDFTIEDSVQTLKVNKVEVDGQTHLVIEKKEMEFAINGELFNFTLNGTENHKSKILVTISGDVEHPIIETNIEIHYKPYIIKGYIEDDLLQSFTGKVVKSFETKEQDDNFNNGLPFELLLNCSGYIEGEGKNRIRVNLNKSSFYFDKDTERKENYIRVLDFDTESDGIILEYDVNPDGSISGESRIYKFGGIFEEVHNQQDTLRSFEGKGSFKLTIEGTTENPEIKLIVDDDFKFVFNYPELYTRYDDWQFIREYQSNSELFDKSSGNLNTSAIIHSTFDDEGKRGKENYYNVKRNTYLKNFAIRLIAADKETDSVIGKSRIYNCEIVGSYEIEPYASIDYPNDIWKFKNEIKSYVNIGQVEINEFGDIVTTDELDELVFSDFGQDVPFIDKNFNLQFTFDGNVPDSTVECYITTNIQPEGVYLEAFNLNEIYQINDSDNYADGVATINGCAEIDKVSVCFVDKNGSPYNRIFMKTGLNDLSTNPPYIHIELYNENSDVKELICSWDGQFIQNIDGNIYGDECIVAKEDNIWKVYLDYESVEASIYSNNFYTERGYYYDLQTHDENKNQVDNHITIGKDLSIANFILNVIKRELLSYNHERVLYTNESKIITGDDAILQPLSLEDDIGLIKNRKYIGKCVISLSANGFKPIFAGDMEKIELIYSITTSVIVKEQDTKEQDTYNIIEEIEINKKENQIIDCYIIATEGADKDTQYCLYNSSSDDDYLNTLVAFDDEYLDIDDTFIIDDIDKDYDINYRYHGTINFTSSTSSVIENEWHEDDSQNITGVDTLALNINFNKDDDGNVDAILDIISRLLKGQTTISLNNTNAYWVNQIDADFYKNIDNEQESNKYNKTPLGDKDFTFEGGINFDWVGILNTKQDNTELTITPKDVDFKFGSQTIGDNLLDDKTIIYLNETVSGKDTMILDGDVNQDGVSISFSTKVDILVDRGVITFTQNNQYVKYIDYNYTVNFEKQWNNVTNFTDWLGKQNHDDKHPNAITGSIGINGEGISYKYDNDGQFNGHVVINSPKLNGVYLDSISDLTINGENSNLSWTYDSTNHSFTIPLELQDDPISSKPIKLNFTLSRGTNFKFTPHLTMYRTEEDRIEFADLIDPFEINDYNISLDEVSSENLASLMSFETGSNDGQSWKSDAIPVYNLSIKGNSVQSELVANKTASASGYVKVSDGLIYTENSGYNGKFDCKANVYGVSSWNTPMEDSDLKSILSGKINDIGNIDKNFGINSAVFELASGSISKNGVQIDRKLILSGQIDIDGGDLVKTDQNNGLPNFVINDLKLKRKSITISATKPLNDIFEDASNDSKNIYTSEGYVLYYPSTNAAVYWNDVSKERKILINGLINGRGSVSINDLQITEIPNELLIKYYINENDEIITTKPADFSISDDYGIVKLTSKIGLGNVSGKYFTEPEIKSDAEIVAAKYNSTSYSPHVYLDSGRYDVTYDIIFSPVTGGNYPDNGCLGKTAKKKISDVENVTINGVSLTENKNVDSTPFNLTMGYDDTNKKCYYDSGNNLDKTFSIGNEKLGVTLTGTVKSLKEILKMNDGKIFWKDNGYCTVESAKYTITPTVTVVEKPTNVSASGKWEDVFTSLPNGIEVDWNTSQWNITNPKVKVFNYINLDGAISSTNNIQVNGFSLNDFRIQGDSQINLNTSNNIDGNDKIYVVLQKVYYDENYDENGKTYVPIRLEASLTCTGTVGVEKVNDEDCLTITDQSISLVQEEVYFYSDGGNSTKGEILLENETYDGWKVTSGSIFINNKEKYVKTSGNKAEIVFGDITIKNSSGKIITLSCPTKTFPYNISDDDGSIDTSNYQTTFSYNAGVKLEGTLVVIGATGKKFNEDDSFTGSVKNVKLIIPEIYVDYNNDGTIDECDLTMLEDSYYMFDYQWLSGSSVDKIIQGLKYNTSIKSIELGISKTQTQDDKEILKTYDIDVEKLTDKVTRENEVGNDITYNITWHG